jgi:transcriptional regulator with XRE-family HTH domain
MKNLGYAIRVLRQARGLTSAALAAKAGISPTYLSLIETGDRTPPKDTLQKLATALGVDPVLLETLSSEGREVPRSARIRSLTESLNRLADAEAELRRKLA